MQLLWQAWKGCTLLEVVGMGVIIRDQRQRRTAGQTVPLREVGGDRNSFLFYLNPHCLLLLTDDSSLIPESRE